MDKAKSIHELTRERIGGIISTGIEKNMTMADISKSILDSVREMSESRAKTIAQTTVTAGFETGQHESFKAANVQKRLWLSQRDGVVRPTHIDADGQEVKIDEPFQVGSAMLMYPGDPSGPAHEVINCRCTELPIIDDTVVQEDRGERVYKQVIALKDDLEAKKKTVASLEAQYAQAYKPKDLAQIHSQLQAVKSDYIRSSKAIREQAHALFLHKKEAEFGAEYIGNTQGFLAKAHVDEGLTFTRKLVGAKNNTKIGKRNVTFKDDTARAYATKTEVHLSKMSDTRTVIHEMGHIFESWDESIAKKAQAFLEERTKNDKLEKLNSVNSAYDASEVFKRDKFIDPYMGKFYLKWGKMYATEIVSMGIEQLYVDPLGFAKADPEYFKFIINLFDEKKKPKKK